MQYVGRIHDLKNIINEKINALLSEATFDYNQWTQKNVHETKSTSCFIVEIFQRLPLGFSMKSNKALIWNKRWYLNVNKYTCTSTTIQSL